MSQQKWKRQIGQWVYEQRKLRRRIARVEKSLKEVESIVDKTSKKK